MKAEIELSGPLKYGEGVWELQAQITCADLTVRMKLWSMHINQKDAEKYRDYFNTFQVKGKNHADNDNPRNTNQGGQ